MSTISTSAACTVAERPAAICLTHGELQTAKRHDRFVICNTDAAWMMRGKLVQKLQMSCEVKCAPGFQDGCQKRIFDKGGRDAGVAGVVCMQLETLRQSSLSLPSVGYCALAAGAEVDATLMMELEDVELTACAVSDGGVVTETVAM